MIPPLVYVIMGMFLALRPRGVLGLVRTFRAAGVQGPPDRDEKAGAEPTSDDSAPGA